MVDMKQGTSAIVDPSKRMPDGTWSWQLTRRCRVALLGNRSTKYAPEFAATATIVENGNRLETRIVPQAVSREMRTRGECGRRLQVQCFRCFAWVCPGHFYSQHLDSGACKRARETQREAMAFLYEDV